MSERLYPDGLGPRLGALRERLAGPLPGIEAWGEMIPPDRLRPPVDHIRLTEGCREGGVLLLVYPYADEPHLVLTVRSAGLRSHGGQVSLPGGRLEPGEDAVGAALREAHEELAVPPDRVEVLGQLTPLYIPPSNYCMTPVVGAMPARPRFRRQVSEVAEIIETPLSLLLDPAARGFEMWEIRGERRRIGFFRVGSHKVWGATAMVLVEFVALWQTLG